MDAFNVAADSAECSITTIAQQREDPDRVSGHYAVDPPGGNGTISRTGFVG